LVNKTLQYLAALVYHDGPQVIRARSRAGNHYVCVLTGVATRGRYLCARVTTAQLDGLLCCRTDLRELILASEELVHTEEPLAKTMQAYPVAGEDLGQSLPEAGFFIQPP
jgi:hypothetical protein